ncbi:MAG: hypothetical protein MR380_09400 [Lachnospiraceae bacterium]|nr:hypothetical protein [Lachnospiraceae bacterium]
MKKVLQHLLAGCFLLVCLLVISPASKVEAYGLTQTGIGKDSVTISWTPEERATKYYVYVGESYDKTRLYATLAPAQFTGSVTISGLPAGCKKFVKVEYDYSSAYSSTINHSMVGSLYDAVTLPGKVTGLKQERWYYFINQFNAVWTKQEGATGYQYRVYTNTKKKKASGTLKSNYPNVSVSKISNSVVYSMQVRAYTVFNGKTYYGAWSNSSYFFTQPRITKLKVSGSKLVVKWGKVGGATGYDVYVSTKPTTGYKRVKSVGKSTYSATISKLSGKKFSSKKKYYVYIVTKKKVGKVTHKSGRLYYWNTKSPVSSFGYF